MSDYDDDYQPQEEPQAYQSYDLFSEADGTISGTTTTNDDRDLGYPNTEASWNVTYRNHAEMLKRTGGSHYGCSGIRVTVYLDGQEVRKEARTA